MKRVCRHPGTILIAVFVFLAALPVSAERAGNNEMATVCNNWLAERVHEQGSWAGSGQPGVIAAHDIAVEGTVLARYYDISPRGFVLVPVLKEMVPVKAYSEQSVLDERQEGGFMALIEEILSDRAERYISLYGDLDAVQPADGEALFGRSQKELWQRYTLPEKAFREELTSKSTAKAQGGPLLSSAWHQGAPYNDYCPIGDNGWTCVVGCVATATAQILNYYEWPPYGSDGHYYYWNGDYSCEGSSPGAWLGADYSDTYDWANMPDSCGEEWTPDEAAALAELCYEVGVAFEMNYGACGSGAYTADAAAVFPTYFRFRPETEIHTRDSYSLADWFDLIQGEIDQNRPIQYRIRSHSIVCDGWRDDGPNKEYHMNYGWGGSFNAWFVLDSLYCSWVPPDSVCPADEEYMITNIIPQTEPVLSIESHSIDVISGDGGDLLEAGETAELTLGLLNSGWDAENVAGLMQSEDEFVTVDQGSAGFGAIAPDQTGSNPTPFQITVDPACPAPYVAVVVVDLSASGGYTKTDSLLLFIGNTPGFSDDMEGACEMWRSWSVSPGFGNQWHLESYRSHSSATSWKMGGNGPDPYAGNVDAALVTPPFLLGTGSTLRYWQWLEVEQDDDDWAFDGALVMLGTSDGNWVQITPMGGYTHSLRGGTPLAEGTPCFSGYQGWQQVEFDLSAYSGVVRLMFRFASDGYIENEGWYVDDIEVQGTGCCVGDRGNIDGGGNEALDISDLVYFVNYMFKEGSEPPCFEEADVDASGEQDISDLVYVVNHMFKEGPAPLDCLQ